jgi:hypothetical protein
MGLVPLAVDPRLLEEKLPEEEYNERNHVRFMLNVKCEYKNDTGKKVLVNEVVYAH